MESSKTRRQVFTVAAGAIAAGSVASMLVTPAKADQGNMEAAINHLNQALQSLHQAPSNKGGHKERAVQMINVAISEVQAGIDWADTH